MAMVPPHVYMVQYRYGADEPPVFSYVIDKMDMAQMVEADMSHALGGVPSAVSREQTMAHWLEQHKNMPPPSHSPAMLSNTTTKWRYDDWRHSPVRVRGLTPPVSEGHLRDDSSEDSFHSNASAGVASHSHHFVRSTASPASGGGGDAQLRFPSPCYSRYHEPAYEKRPFNGHHNGGYHQRPRQKNFRPRNQTGASSQALPPDRYLGHDYLVHVHKSPSHINSTDHMSKSIWNMFMMNQQTVETYRKKISLWRDLFVFIRASFPKHGLYMVGSTMSGLGTNTSDVDMCLLVRSVELDARNDALVHLGQIAHHLRQSNMATNVEMIHAKVPILKLKCKGYEIDLNCNNSVGIRNTHLLYCYAQMDWRVRPLVVVVRLWAARHNINDAKRMSVSSYSWALMVIHYLQCGAKPKVLPCLQRQYPEKFLQHSDINSIDLHEELPPHRSENKESLSELFIGFLQYYKDFDYAAYAVSVRVAGRVPIEECRHARTFKNDPTQWKYLCIEEPFDLTNTARSVYDYGAFERVRRVVQASCERIKTTARLDSLFERNFQPL